jgi:hypothetical protein
MLALLLDHAGPMPRGWRLLAWSGGQVKPPRAANANLEDVNATFGRHDCFA